MAGSLLEAILYDRLMKDPTAINKALDSKNASKNKKTGKVKDLTKDRWELYDLIQVSVENKVLPEDRAKTFDQILRDYRNFVHANKERRAKHPCTEAEAFMAKGALDGVCNHL